MSYQERSLAEKTPRALVGPVNTIRVGFEKKSVSLSSDLEALCYACLHKEEKRYSSLDSQRQALQVLTGQIDPSERTQIKWWLDLETPIGYFAAFFRLHVLGIRFFLREAFADLWTIIRNHTSPVLFDRDAWCLSLTRSMIHDYRPMVVRWIKWVCNQPDWDNDEDEELLTRSKWRAPRFLNADPDVDMPGADPAPWTAFDEKETGQILDAIIQREYSKPLLEAVHEWLAEAQLSLAKDLKQTSTQKKRNAPKRNVGNSPNRAIRGYKFDPESGSINIRGTEFNLTPSQSLMMQALVAKPTQGFPTIVSAKKLLEVAGLPKTSQVKDTWKNRNRELWQNFIVPAGRGAYRLKADWKPGPRKRTERTAG